MESRLSAPDRGDLLARVFHGSSQGVLVARLDDGRILETNDAFLFLVDRDRDEVVGRTTADLGLFAEPGEERVYRLLRHRGSIEGFDARVPTLSGETRILRLWAEVVPGRDGSLVVVRASDVDGRASAGARYHELREAEVRYRALVEQIPAITYTQVPDERSPTGFRDVYTSPQTKRILGYEPSELQDDPSLWVLAVHPEDRERVVNEELASARGATTFASEYRMIARDGRVVWFRDEAALVEDPASGLAFWQGVMLDITEQKLAAAHRAEVEAKYRALVEQIPAIVYLGEYGEEGDWLYISPQLERVLGYTPDEWLAHPHPLQSFTHPDDIAAVRAEESRSQREGNTFRAEYRMQAKDGRWVWILNEATAVRGESGPPLFLQGVMYDMTERKRAEEELAKANEQLRALDRLKDTLLHTLSHDLRAPLTAIMGAASTLARLDRELPEGEREALLRTLEDRTHSMNKLLTDLLDLDRLDQGIIEPRRFPVDLGALVRDLVGRVDALKGREVTVDADHVVIGADQPKLERMVENLLSNAARHTPPGCCVWVRVEKRDGGALLCVEDNGPGVPDDLKEPIFEAFRRGLNTTKPGSGLGLSLVARFAELQGGRAWVEDRPGGGASFRVFLPDVAPVALAGNPGG